MPFRIEKIPIKTESLDNRQVRFAEFVDTLADLKVGESFLFPLKMQTTHRLAVTIASRLLKREFIVHKEAKGARIGRTG